MSEQVKEYINLGILIALPLFLIACFIKFKINKFRELKDKIYIDKSKELKFCIDCISCKSDYCRNVRSTWNKKEVKEFFACWLYREKVN